ncbi:hypothetical protein CCOS865_01239 [Pseudomonas reidholzensis]|uniref:Uncharacterized protein n=1 Tax=Pseudomonas reidholzensis TaxID=1785162 RepID=A0A383RPJ3_9PSED|nr:hypothetical protein [Pseudomonas reidholzensis]SYX88999.1 hypothetical protein CCOS865_01239 [Pseudomonas reidholzensis]
MTDLTALDNLVLQLATGGIAAPAMRREVTLAYPWLTDSQFFSTLLSLQNKGLLAGQEITGVWVLTALTEQPTECSPAFAEMIIAADCGEWHALDADELIAELDRMIRKARARKRR